ncbi:GntR family transcriptional regulator [Bordetella hinzii]|uniref:GntR family transcriptional regulator n=2 Tax=Bordetella hinzii TaxID=103855 RepID=A0AAN1VFN9_9BORD|nr:GntR family transcriptional regulator [Bordetella hinzii]AKQ57514.1 HTH-type transcriptional repressor CsiR [Bordetella hinzii]AKQ61980.1 HTH-type transcriptional repressor CsiR [Bordetella hinzii]AZW17096.1 GntR family transcriptional regulator [Bordetella hinzii]KCB22815.1 FCD domain protein [Bordetella hinzii OH87 BAL007II]KCB34044.1 FCD domain protein [Bordetella hinzii CA90 BAL1384]
MPLEPTLPVKAPATIPYFLQEQIRELIIDGTFRPGQPLREQELEQRFGTSRSPIREALRLLELTGLVAHMQRKGFRVRRYTETEIRHIYALRAELAAYGLRQLDGVISDELLRELRTCDQEMARAYAAQDIRGYADFLRRFYLAGVRYAGNTPLEDTLTRLYEQVEPMRYIFLRHALADLAYDTFHREVLRALEAGEALRAAEAARDHVQRHLPGIVRAYDEAAAEAGVH